MATIVAANAVFKAEQTTDCFTIRYAPTQVNPASAALLRIVAGTAVMLTISVTVPPSTFVVLAQALLAGLVMACVVSLAKGKAAPPPMVQTTRFNRDGTIRVDIERQGASPEVTELSFGDVAELRVHTAASHGSRSDTLMLVRKQGKPVILAFLIESSSSSQVLAMAEALRAWTGLPGPQNTLLNSVALWTSSTGSR